MVMSARYQKWLPVIDDALCTGCGSCVEACGTRSLQMVNRTAALLRPGVCGSDEHCVVPCEQRAIHMQWVDLDGDKDRGKWRAEVDLLEMMRNREKKRR
jgi:Na+-translocating ferredoxin:NAD+ oxidoreductase RNF subunit RnfB